MPAESFPTQQLAKLMADRFRGRRDAYAVRRKDPDRDGKHPFHPARSTDRCDLPLTAGALEDHINGGATVGMYPRLV
jgi:hypothetical protein